MPNKEQPTCPNCNNAYQQDCDNHIVREQPQENKLLSDEQLRKKVRQIVAMNADRLFYVDTATDEIMGLIQSQKLAWADMVIGRNQPETGSANANAAQARNNLRAEQRERNKL